MGILRHRRFRRQESPPANDDGEDEYDEDGEEGDDDDDDSATTPPGAGLPLTTTENQFEKAKAIGKDVIEKVPSEYISIYIHRFLFDATFAILHSFFSPITIIKKRKM